MRLFLMHRVELKVYFVYAHSVAFVMFLMHRVELKEPHHQLKL